MTTEKLMKPRYKIISKYPGSEDWEEIGAIISLPDKRYKYADLMLCGKYYFDSYPNIYEPLQWWEEREISDMPEYVKVNTKKTCLFLGNLLKVRIWKIRPAGHLYCWVEEDKAKSFPDMFKYTPDTFLPATLEEYNEYINPHPPQP